MAKEINPDIKGPDKIDPEQPIGDQDRLKNPDQSFDSYMQGEGNPSQVPTGSTAPSPYDLASANANALPGPTMDSVKAQMESTSGVLGDLQNQLQTKNLKLKQSQKYLLRNKLSDASSLLDTVAKNTGATVPETTPNISRQSPIAKFISYVTNGQNRMRDAQKMISTLGAGGKPLNPGKLLLIQVKLAKAQQELEYSSVLLSKAVDDVKQVFNIQI